MYVIKRKRICLILIALLLGIFAYSYENQKINIDEQTQSTTATPVSGKVIVVDAGHGVPDERDKMLKLKNKTLQMAIYQRNILVG